MRGAPETFDDFRLVFSLPGPAMAHVPQGRWQPCLHKCMVTNVKGEITVAGPSRETTLLQARRFGRDAVLPALRAAGETSGRAIRCLLLTPWRPWCPSGQDGWNLIVGAQVATVPSPVEPELFTDSALA